MSTYLTISGNNTSQSYECQTTHISTPYLKVSNKYLDLTTNLTYTTSNMQGTSTIDDGLRIKPSNQIISTEVWEKSHRTFTENGFSGICTTKSSITSQFLAVITSSYTTTLSSTFTNQASLTNFQTTKTAWKQLYNIWSYWMSRTSYTYSAQTQGVLTGNVASATYLVTSSYYGQYYFTTNASKQVQASGRQYYGGGYISIYSTGYNTNYETYSGYTSSANQAYSYAAWWTVKGNWTGKSISASLNHNSSKRPSYYYYLNSTASGYLYSTLSSATNIYVGTQTTEYITQIIFTNTNQASSTEWLTTDLITPVLVTESTTTNTSQYFLRNIQTIRTKPTIVENVSTKSLIYTTQSIPIYRPVQNIEEKTTTIVYTSTCSFYEYNWTRTGTGSSSCSGSEYTYYNTMFPLNSTVTSTYSNSGGYDWDIRKESSTYSITNHVLKSSVGPNWLILTVSNFTINGATKVKSSWTFDYRYQTTSTASHIAPSGGVTLSKTVDMFYSDVKLSDFSMETNYSELTTKHNNIRVYQCGNGYYGTRSTSDSYLYFAVYSATHSVSFQNPTAYSITHTVGTSPSVYYNPEATITFGTSIINTNNLDPSSPVSYVIEYSITNSYAYTETKATYYSTYTNLISSQSYQTTHYFTKTTTTLD